MTTRSATSSLSTAELGGASFKALLAAQPAAADFLAAHLLPEPAGDETPERYFASLEDPAKRALLPSFLSFLAQLSALFARDDARLDSLRVIGGRGKDGTKEELDVVLLPGDILCVVGPTGSGKSRLLADIECLAQGDTPSGRRILVNGSPAADALRFEADSRLVAQVSQNMNFVVDLCVADFLAMHAESRLVENPHMTAKSVFETANSLAGEPFSLDSPVTSLSGGQSRALMIADTACLSHSPVILIDEIENAGVDRRRALELLISREKIVVMSTHDPALALMAPRRLVVSNGAVKALVERSQAELAVLAELEALAAKVDSARRSLRAGESLA